MMPAWWKRWRMKRRETKWRQRERDMLGLDELDHWQDKLEARLEALRAEATVWGHDRQESQPKSEPPDDPR